MITLETVIAIGIDILKKILFSVFVIIAGNISIKIVKGLLKKTIAKWGKRLPETKLATIQSLLCSIAKYAINFFVLYTILVAFGVESNAILAVTGIGSIAIGFASQSLVKDVINGASIILENSFEVGDTVSFGLNYVGKVESFGLRTTKVRAENGDLHIIPNGEIKIITKINTDS